jgi:hypothetical protein
MIVVLYSPACYTPDKAPHLLVASAMLYRAVRAFERTAAFARKFAIWNKMSSWNFV